MSKKDTQQEVASALMAISATSLLMTAYRMYKDYLSKAARACDTMTGRDKSLCMTKYKMEATRRHIEQLRKDMSKCNQAKDPEKCMEKIREKIEDLQQKHKKLQKKFRMIYNLAKKAEKERSKES